jgi:hypothetical protein
MKRPLARGRAIDMRRIRGWLQDFSGYRHTVNEHRIDRWLNQFAAADRDLAARLLDCVDFMTSEQISAAYRNALAALPGWHIEQERRHGRWLFVPYAVSAGESGDSMLHRFRHANNLASGRFNSLFLHKSDLLRLGLGPEDIVVFVDDFSGTGDQIVRNWPLLEELIPGAPRTHLVLAAATSLAIDRIQSTTTLNVQADYVFTREDNVFHASCRHFTPAEKARVLEYCQIAAPREPRGRGESGLVVVFSHNCPNNSLPILHVSRGRWEGLFRRYD